MSRSVCIRYMWAGMSLLMVACSGAQLSGTENPYRDSANRLLSNESSLVLYREKTGEDAGQSPSVWINNRLVGALLPGQYIQSVLCEGIHQIGVAPRQGEAIEERTAVNAVSGQTVYLQVRQSSTGGFIVDAAPREDARQSLEKLSYQSHLLNRNQPDCRIASVPAEVLLREVELGSDALFRFGKGGISDILPEGRMALDRLVDDILYSDIKVDRINIIGYTDRLGSEEYNERLSEERASSVAQYLRIKDIRGPIDFSGRGTQDPVTTGCEGSQPTQALIACLQPDRRVNIELWGTLQEVIGETELAAP